MASGDQFSYQAGEVKGQTEELNAGHVFDAAKDTAVAGKDKTGDILQQTGVGVKSAAVGATNAVKNTLGIGETDSSKTSLPSNDHTN